VTVLLKFEFPPGSCWEGQGRLVEIGGRRRLERRTDSSDFWWDHPSENAAEVASLVYDAMMERLLRQVGLVEELPVEGVVP
jgi:hypothetical protein